MDDGWKRDLEHIGLPTACALVYAGITGATPDPRGPEDMQVVLNDVARALAYVIRIYTTEPGNGVPRPISGFDAMRGKFVRGAHAFHMPDGKKLERLTVQRRDMHRAIDVLRSARVKFAPHVAG
jgi:hypothetical protein